MKKLLALLGAFSLTSTAAAGVVACTAQMENSKVYNKLLEQYSKALFISEQGTLDKHVSANYIFNDLLGGSTLRDLGLNDLADEAGVTTSKTFASVSEKYLDTTNLTTETKVSKDIYQDGVITLDAGVDPTIQSILNYVPTIFGLMKNPVEALTMLESVIDLESLVSGDMLKQLAGSLTPENMKLLENAFSNDVYANLDLTYAINSSIIGLGNALDLLINQDDAKSLEYTDVETINNNILESTTNLGININGLISGEKTMSFDMNKDIPAIAEIIRFVRTMLMYLNSYSFEEMTNDLLTYDEIKTKRKTKISEVENTIDVKKIVNVLKVLVNDEDGKGSFVLRNVVGVIFLTTEYGGVMDDTFSILTEAVERDTKPSMGKYFTGGGYASIVGNLVMQMLGGEKSTVAEGQTVYYRPIIRTLLNGAVLGASEAVKKALLYGTVVKALPGLAESMPDFLKNALNAISENGDFDKFADNILLYLWDNDNEKLNFTLKGFMSEPLSGVMSLFGSSESKGFEYVTNGFTNALLSKSLKDLVNTIDTGLSEYDNTTVNFDDFAQLIELCAKDDTLKKALNDPSNWLKILGFVDGKIVEGSVVEKLVEIIQSLEWIQAITTPINELLKDYQKELNPYKAEVMSQLEKLTVEDLSVNGTTYTYKVSDGTNSKTYAIKLKETDGKSVISEIS